MRLVLILTVHSDQTQGECWVQYAMDATRSVRPSDKLLPMLINGFSVEWKGPDRAEGQSLCWPIDNC